MRTRKLAGVWIDSSKAVITTLEGEDHALTVLGSDIEGHERVDGEGRQAGRFGDQYMDDEQAKNVHRNDAEHKFTVEVVEKIKDADQLIIFGPAHMKHKLESTVRSLPAPAPNIRAVESADAMTDNQVAAYVREFYGKSGLAANP